MCIVCVQYEKGKLTLAEANRALVEMFLAEGGDQEHALEAAIELNEREE